MSYCIYLRSEKNCKLQLLSMYSVASILLKVFTYLYCPPFISNSILADFPEARVVVSHNVFFCVSLTEVREKGTK